MSPLEEQSQFCNIDSSNSYFGTNVNKHHKTHHFFRSNNQMEGHAYKGRLIGQTNGTMIPRSWDSIDPTECINIRKNHHPSKNNTINRTNVKETIKQRKMNGPQKSHTWTRRNQCFEIFRKLLSFGPCGDQNAWKGVNSLNFYPRRATVSQFPIRANTKLKKINGFIAPVPLQRMGEHQRMKGWEERKTTIRERKQENSKGEKMMISSW